MKKVILTKEKCNNCIYIGRPSVFGNPFPTKKSKYSEKIYDLKASLELYHEYFKENILNSSEFLALKEKLRKDKIITLKCFCINKEIIQISDIDFNNLKCHGEIIAYYLLKD